MANEKRFICSDESVNTYGFRVLTEGIDITQFLRNPVMLYDHGDNKEFGNMPIGKWLNIEKKDNQILATPDFDQSDPKAKKINDKVDGGYINMASVGLAPPYEWSDDPALKLLGQTAPTLVKSRLKEISPTPFGGNLNALKLYDDNGQEINLNDNSTFKIQQPMLDIKKNVAAALNLSDSATEAEIIKTAISLSEKNKELATQNEALEKENTTLKTAAANAEKETLLKDAVDKKQITAKQKEAYLKLSMEDIKAVLADSKPAVNLSAVPGSEADENDPLLKLSYSELDKIGKLSELKEKNPEAFKSKFKAAFGTDYKG